jgi:uncharacterized membrane protein YedE/YeeE
MLGAVAVAALGFQLAKRRGHPVFEPKFHQPGKRRIDRPLVAGAILFGIGWGLVGYCPGPALSSLALGRSETLLFVAAMIAGMAAYRCLELFGKPSREGGAPPAA